MDSISIEKVQDDTIMVTVQIDDSHLELSESTLFLTDGKGKQKIGSISYRVETEERPREELIAMFEVDIAALEAAENSLVDIYLPGDLYIHEIEVEPQYRHMGYGTLILRWLEQKYDGFSVILTASYHDANLIEFFEQAFTEYEIDGIVERTITYRR